MRWHTHGGGLVSHKAPGHGPQQHQQQLQLRNLLMVIFQLEYVWGRAETFPEAVFKDLSNSTKKAAILATVVQG